VLLSGDKLNTRRQRPNPMRLSAPRLVCLLVAGAIAAPCAQQPNPDSVERIRAALTRPPSRLTLVERPPDFTIHVEERRPLQDIFYLPPWASPEFFFAGYTKPSVFAPIEGLKGGFSNPGISLPGRSSDVLGPTQSLVSGMARTVRVNGAQREVQRTLAEYCAAQPNGGAAIAVCSSLPTLR
jgi:hypothetical protein